MTQFTSTLPEHKTGTFRSRPTLRSGSILLESVMAMVVLAVVGLVLFKGALNTIAPRQWSLVQNISDAYLTYEKAYAERVEFGELTADASPWPVYPAKHEHTVTMGTLPGGGALSGRVIRTRKPDSNNFPDHGGSGTTVTNPAESQVWILQSLVVYQINNREYVKSRSIVRTQ